MNKENTNNESLYNLLQEFYEKFDLPTEEYTKSFIEKLSLLCQGKNCRCRPSYHEVARFVMDNWEENDSLDYFIEALESIAEDSDIFFPYENLCEKEDGKICSLNDFFIKIVDHIKLEQLRLNSLSDKLKREYLKNDKKQKELELQIKMFQTTLDAVKENNQKVTKELSRNKFDLIALTTLIFSAFTLIQINVSTFAAVAGKPIGDAILLMSMINIIVITSIMAIYSVIRKIHGDINDEELYRNMFFLLATLIFVGLFGYYML